MIGMIGKIAIVGDGAMGTLCALLLADKVERLVMWGAFADQVAALRAERENKRFLPGHRLPANLAVTDDGAAALAEAELVVSAVPVQYVRSVWEKLRPHLADGVPICSVAKGIENETLLRPTQVLTDVLGPVPVAALSGPCIASEVARKLPASVVAASADAGLRQQVQRLFSTPWFRVYTNDDLVGVELAAAVKNVIALAAGAIDGLEVGDNAKAALVTRGLVEIGRLGEAMGANRETFAGLAGLGDLVTTCISPASRNRSTGERLGRGEKLADILASRASVVEGVATTQSVMALARKYAVELPITASVYAVLFEDKTPGDVIAKLMQRELRAE